MGIPVHDGPGVELLVVHVLTDGRQQPELLSLTALLIDQHGVPGQHWRWPVRTVRPLPAALVRQLRIDPNELTSARPWEEIADDVATVLGTRTVLVYQGWPQFCLLERYLPRWRPDQVLAVRQLARHLGRDIDIVERWRAADCGDAGHAALLYRLFVELAAGAWSTSCSMAELPIAKYRPALRRPGKRSDASQSQFDSC